MIPTIVVSGCTCLGIILTVLIKPSVKIGRIDLSLYWIIALTGAAVLLVSGLADAEAVFGGLIADTQVNPLKILTLFISMTLLSIFLDEAGFFKYLADVTLRRAKSSRKKLLVYLFVVVSVLTVFTSNDILILTFTPFVCYFAKASKINPTPYLLAEFTAANTFSSMLLIGNPTNIYLATAAGITFTDYFLVMAVPALLSGISGFAVIYLMFRKSLSAPMSPPETQSAVIKNKPLLVIGIVCLAACTVLLVISPYLNLEMWLITLVFSAALIISSAGYSIIKKRRPAEIGRALARCPWELIPFVISMFVIVLALNLCGFTEILGGILSQGNSIITFGTASTLLSNLINNIPMSVLMEKVIASLSGNNLAAVYATIIGSNVGALLTPAGALAGIMWMGILKKHEVKFSFGKFVKYGIIITPVTLFAGLAGLALMML